MMDDVAQHFSERMQAVNFISAPEERLRECIKQVKDLHKQLEWLQK